MLPHDKLEGLTRRYAELDDLMCQPQVLSDRNQLPKLTKEGSDLGSLVAAYATFQTKEKELADARELLSDPDFRADAQVEVDRLGPELVDLEKSIELLLLPKDPNDAK